MTIASAESLLPAGNVEHRRIQSLMEGFRERFAKPFQARSRREIFEGNYDHGSGDHSSTDRRDGGVLGAKQRADKQRRQKDENNGAFHDQLIISLGDGASRPALAGENG